MQAHLILAYLAEPLFLVFNAYFISGYKKRGFPTPEGRQVGLFQAFMIRGALAKVRQEAARSSPTACADQSFGSSKKN